MKRKIAGVDGDPNTPATEADATEQTEYFSQIVGESQEDTTQIYRPWTEQARVWLLGTLSDAGSADQIPDYLANELPTDATEFWQVYGNIIQLYEHYQSQTESTEDQTPRPKSDKTFADIGTTLNAVLYRRVEKDDSASRGQQAVKKRSSTLSNPNFDPASVSSTKLTADDIDWKRSKDLVSKLFGSYKTGGQQELAYDLLCCWNRVAPEDQQLTLRQAGLPDNFSPANLAEKPQPGMTMQLQVGNETYTLEERGGVRGGNHAMFDPPPALAPGKPALIRKPRPGKEWSIASGMDGYRQVKQQFEVPRIYNNDPANDGYYLVEKIDGDLDVTKPEHQRQVADAFRLMTEQGASFPFDLRCDNIKFKDDRLVVIDFSESDGLGGEPGFWCDSLMEFCWRRTTRQPADRNSSSGSDVLNRLIAAAVKNGHIPVEYSRSPEDYDSTMFTAIWNALDPKVQHVIEEAMNTPARF